MKLFNKEFDFDFFGRKKAERIKQLEENNQFLNEENLELMNQQSLNNVDSFFNLKPYKNIIYSNDILTVVFHDGSVLSEVKDSSFIEQVENATTKSEIIRLMRKTDVNKTLDDNTEEKEIIQTFAKYEEDVIELLGNDFNYKNSNFYYKNISLPINSLILNSLIELKKNDKKEEFTALLNFFLKLCLNPIESSKESLMLFVKNNDVRLSKSGNMILYRNIVSISSGNKKLIAFISQQFLKIKAWKKSPTNYSICHLLNESDYQLIKNTKIATPEFQEQNFIVDGNLQELYNNLHTLEENKYTSKHNRGKYTINIGSVYKIENKDINLNSNVCNGGGLHAASVNYNYSSYGDTRVVVLVSPSKAITVPVSDTGKLRTTEMFICCINEKENGKHYFDGELSAFDSIYSDYSTNELEEAIQNKSFESFSIKEQVPNINLLELKEISNSLKSKIVTF